MFKRSTLFLLLTLVCVFSHQIDAQISNSLPRSTPESQGVSSKAILNFLDAANNSKNEFHSIMILRHGKVIAEGWWNPYKPELKHMLYSLSKSFTSTAIGFAVQEKLLTVNDNVISFFPKQLPDTISDNLKELKVKDLLCMAAGQDPDPTWTIRNWNIDWVKSFLETPIKEKPGTKFLYNSVATFMLSAIIQQVTAQKLIDYLKPRLFDPLGIKGMDWETSPLGINTGGWGLRLKTEDIAKMGLLYLQKGKWNGKQLLTKEWIEEATTMKILQSPEVSKEKRDSSDWLQGYGYKFWRCRYGVYRGDGAFGQLMIIMPDQDAVVAVTCETYDIQNELNLVWKYLLPAFGKKELPLDAQANKQLKAKLKSLALPVVKNTSKENMESKITAKLFKLVKNDKQMENISFNFKNNTCRVKLKEDSVNYNLGFGLNKLVIGETMRRGPNLIGDAKNSCAGLPSCKTAGSYIWKDVSTLELTLRYIESPHKEIFTCHFDGNKISIEITSSLDPKAKPIVISGYCL